jgi:hypothetical protein
MAGSYGHIRGEDGKFTMDGIENIGDAHEALEECFHMIEFLSGGKAERRVLALHYFMRTCYEHHAKECHFCKDLVEQKAKATS